MTSDNNRLEVGGLANQKALDWLSEPFHLALSAGFFGFFAHTGMLSALVDRNIRPQSLSGASAGALVAGLYAAGLEPAAVATILLTVSRKDFWDPGVGLGLLKGNKFLDMLESHLPVRHIEECRVPLALSVFDVKKRKNKVIKSGNLSKAIAASCALPGLFRPVKYEGMVASDGGIKDRHGLEGAQEQPRVFYHHLSSKSPWRHAASLGLSVPNKKGLVSLSLHDLPRVSPFKLEKGLDALNQAYKLTTELLDR